MSAVVSSKNFYDALRASILRIQTDLDRTQVEAGSGRRADVGRDLGSAVGGDLRARNQLQRASAMIDANKAVSARLQASQSALGSIGEVVDAFRRRLIAGTTNGADVAALHDEAQATLRQVVALANASVDGRSLFGGVRSEVAPIADYPGSPAGAAKTAVDAAFLAEFSIAQDAPGAGSISASAMQTFLNGAYADLFAGGPWTTLWSSASDTAVKDEIMPGSSVATSVSANEAGLRDAISALVMVADLGVQSLSGDTRGLVISTAASRLGASADQLGRLSTRLGVVQSSVDFATDALTSRSTFLQGRIDDYESVDPAATATALSMLSTQLQSAYAVTARIQNLSLLNYL